MNISASQFIAFFTVAVPTLAGLFSFWLASIKDGFDQEKAFDLVAYGLTGGVAVNLAVAMGKARALIFDVTAINPFAFLFGFMAVISYVVLKRKWSLYRVADNLAISLTLAAGFWLLMRGFLTGFRPVYLLLAVLLFIAYYFLQKYRPLVIKSGFTFCLVVTIFCAASAVSTSNFVNLLFVGLLFTLTLIVLISRLRMLYGRHKKGDHSTHLA